MKFYQQVRSMKKSKLAKFQDHIISIDGVMTSQIIRHDVKIWWRQISVKNVGIALKLFRLFNLVIALICLIAEISLADIILRTWERGLTVNGRRIYGGVSSFVLQNTQTRFSASVTKVI